jgi:UDP-3-O-[3-hydroxymyristoyl] N-acetylglucosamine deacetylase
MAVERTINREVTVAGVGFHTGERAVVRLLPARHGSGVVFLRDAGRPLPARAENVVGVTGVALGRGDRQVGSTEHLLAALYGLGITDLAVEVDGPELPILDGSAAPWVALLEQAGLVSGAGRVPEIVVRRPLRVEAGSRFIELHPAPAVAVDCRVRFPIPVGSQRILTTLSPRRFAEAIAPARTFEFLADVPALRRLGLGHGASLDSCVVFDRDRVLSGPLRFPDEPVRHKVVDLLGVLALLEYPLRALVVAVRPGHGLALALIRELLARPEHWDLLDPERVVPFSVTPVSAEDAVAVAS